jgi:hypothetical protein
MKNYYNFFHMKKLETFNISHKLRPISCQFKNQMKTSLDLLLIILFLMLHFTFNVAPPIHILQHYLISKKPKYPTSKQDHKWLFDKILLFKNPFHKSKYLQIS